MTGMLWIDDLGLTKPIDSLSDTSGVLFRPHLVLVIISALVMTLLWLLLGILAILPLLIPMAIWIIFFVIFLRKGLELLAAKIPNILSKETAVMAWA